MIWPLKHFCNSSRWDISVIEQLPDYMQLFYKALLDLFDGIEDKLADMEGQSYRMFYAKEAVSLELWSAHYHSRTEEEYYVKH